MKRKLDQETLPASSKPSTNQRLHQKVPSASPESGSACPICGVKLSSVSSTESGQNAHVNTCMDLAMASGRKIHSMVSQSGNEVHDHLKSGSNQRKGGGRRDSNPGKKVGIRDDEDGHDGCRDSDDEDGGERLCADSASDHKKKALGRATGGVRAASEMVDLTSDGDIGDASEGSPGKPRPRTISLLSPPHPAPSGPSRSSISKW